MPNSIFHFFHSAHNATQWHFCRADSHKLGHRDTEYKERQGKIMSTLSKLVRHSMSAKVDVVGYDRKPWLSPEPQRCVCVHLALVLSYMDDCPARR